MDRYKIEQQVRALQAEIYRSAELLHPKYSGDPLELWEPQFLAQILGVQYYEQPGLSEQPFLYRGQRMATAGLIDPPSNRIVVEPNFSTEICRFTGAHECGHRVLHRLQRMHRDLPLDGSPPNHVRPPMEREADFFAAVFLMPRKLVVEEFIKRFGTNRLPFNNTVAHLICPENPDKLLYAETKSLEREKALASCRITRGNHYPSLSQTFRVSKTAMAIRLKELQLIEWP